MYVPHYDAILHSIGTSREKLGEKAQIEIPVAMFKFLLRIALNDGEFNSPGYLASNKDIQDAVRKGQVPDPKAHYLNFGYFEGRRGAAPAVDEAWYRRNYTDIANAIRKGDIQSGSDHFDTIGAEEFRAPAATYITDAAEWKRVAGKN